ncbi:MAG: histidine--tRNA ligase [bacterium]
MINRVKGTQDILNLKLHDFVISLAEKHMQIYNFTKIETPIIEYTKLFTRSLGEQTDVVTKEMFTIPPRNEDEDSITLRPEATASTMRAYFENNVTEKPWKTYSYGAMFRYERPQKGRWRQFEQFNIEVINAPSIMHDAQFIKMLDVFFSEKLNINSYVIKLNFLGKIEDRKIFKDKLYEFLSKNESKICETCKERKEKNILRVFDCKSETCQKIYANSPKLTNYLSEKSLMEWNSLLNTLDILSVSYVVDHKLVRGLDYYNKTVFEFSSDELGAQNAFCGGGRYNLAKEIGEKEEFDSTGCAIGMGRLLMLVEKYQNNLAIPQEKAINIILPMSEQQQELALLLAYNLQSNNICADVLLDTASMTNMMKKANKLGAKNVLILGEVEQEKGTVTVKNMQTGKSETVKQTEVIKYL